MEISITQASETYGINRTMLYRYMDNGTLSYQKLANGKRALNPGEIERVFGERLKNQKMDGTLQTVAPSNVQHLETKTALLEETIKRLERENERLQEDKQDLRGRLDAAEKRADKTLYLLEYHQTQASLPWWKSIWKSHSPATAH